MPRVIRDTSMNVAARNLEFLSQWERGVAHAIADQVFRFEYCFLLKDGTYSNIPVLTSNGLQNNTTASAPPAPTNDSTQSYSTGSRWFDAKDGARVLERRRP